ncbi:MAG TPA: TSUP family transporter, partial [Rubrobacter sp.]|nr:TSUP family transporter [Rubrobacter sp.]
MDYLQFLFLGAIGVVGGMLSGLVGVGGGIVFVPGLLYVGGWNIQDAVAASLVIIVFSSLSGTIRNARSSDPVNWRVAGLLSLAVAPSTLIGVLISRVSPEVVVKVAFATLL